MTTHPVSPNTVLTNALLRAEDVLAPRILATPPARIVLVVGTQINGAPHTGTSLVQSLAFAMAARLCDRFGIPTEVLFSALRLERLGEDHQRRPEQQRGRGAGRERDARPATARRACRSPIEVTVMLG